MGLQLSRYITYRVLKGLKLLLRQDIHLHTGVLEALDQLVLLGLQPVAAPFAGIGGALLEKRLCISSKLSQTFLLATKRSFS